MKSESYFNIKTNNVTISHNKNYSSIANFSKQNQAQSVLFCVRKSLKIEELICLFLSKI